MARQIHKRTSKRWDLVLATNEVAVQGNLAFGDPTTGLVVATPAAGRRRLGHFAEDLTGDGTTKVVIELPREITTHLFDNAAAAAAVDFAFTDAFAVDGHTVSDTGDVRVGLVWEVTSAGVRVQTH